MTSLRTDFKDLKVFKVLKVGSERGSNLELFKEGQEVAFCNYSFIFVPMIHLSTQIRIAVTGPESTGKTTLALQLAEKYNGQYIPEFAREYVEKLPRHYNYDDVEEIAIRQVEQYRATQRNTERLFIFDTWLIITKVWFNWVFNKTPAWLDQQIRNCPVDLFLLCLPDLPWEADPVRENGGENRLKLLDLYRKELRYYNFPFIEIGGSGNQRLQSAMQALENFNPSIKL